tara:strand:+ start:639 stop:1034 length:396 start_codon:yes stop_codon:yes gene_type:complete
MSESSTLSVGPLSEVILYVADMAAQVAFYRDMLGLKIRFPSNLEDYNDQFWVVFETGACALALHGGGENDFGKDAPKVVFDIEDPESARKTLKSLGVPVSEIHSPAPGVQVLEAKDPEGNLFSLESRADSA